MTPYIFGTKGVFKFGVGLPDLVGEALQYCQFIQVFVSFFVCFCFFLCVCFRISRSEGNRSFMTSECTTKSISLKFSGSNQVLKWSIVAFYDQVILKLGAEKASSFFFFFFLIVADKFTVLSFLEALEDSVSKTSELESSRGDDKDSRSQTCNQNDPMDEGK